MKGFLRRLASDPIEQALWGGVLTFLFVGAVYYFTSLL